MRRVLRTIVILSLLPMGFCLSPQVTLSLEPSRSIAQFHHTQWTSREGAPSQLVALTQTRDGFLWIGTSRGLFRFDGVRFEPYVRPSGVDLPSANIYSLKATDDGGLWVAFRPSGVGFIKQGTIDVFNTHEQLPRSQIYCFEIDGTGRLWAGTHDGLAVRRDDGGWTEIGEGWGFTPRRVRSMFTDSKGRMWVAVDDSIVMLPKGTDRFEKVEDKVDAINAWGESPDGRIWIGENQKLLRPVLSGSTLDRTFGIKLSGYVGSILFDRDGTLWFTDADGIKRVRDPRNLESDIISVGDPRLELFDIGDDLSGPILEDREGTIWIGSPQGLNRFRYSYFVANKASARYRNMTLSADPQRGIWVGSSLQLPLAHFDEEKVTTVPDSTRVSSVFRDANGLVWWGAHSRLLRQDGDKLTSHAQPATLKDDWFWEVFPAGEDEYLWVRSGDYGLLSFEDGRWGTRPQPSGLPDRGPSASFSEARDRTWLGYTENRAAIIENGIARLFTSADGINVGRIRVIRKGGDRIWVGGELGLAVFDGSRFHTIKTNEADRFATVSGIVFSRDGALWLNEVQGIVRIPREEVDRVIADPDYRVGFRRFDFQDGLPGSPQMNWTASTAVESADGRLWFATDGGLASTEPTNLIANPLPPPVTIRHLNIGERSYDVYHSIELPEGTEDLSIEYTALSLSIPERVQFRYLLEGVDSDWREARSRREAYYTNLGPGEYRFRVIAANNDGVWNNDGAVLNFRILPKFYQTNWFLGLCLLGFTTLVILAFRLRLEQIKTRMHLQFQERLAERGRIAQDLHDTLLQGFVSASMQLDVAVDSLPGAAPERSRFERVHEMIKRLINEGRETVAGLRSSSTTGKKSFEELFFEMREEFDIGREVDFRVTLGGQPRTLHPIIHDEVCRIAQEAIFNAFRHAEASNIEVDLMYSARKFQLAVHDDGRGIEPDVIASGRKGHWGLTGMRERAENIGAMLKVWSAKGRGTKVVVTIPGHVAYRDREAGGLKRIFGRFSERFRRKQTERE